MKASFFRSARAVAVAAAFPLLSPLTASGVTVVNNSFEDGLLTHPNFDPDGPNFFGIAPDTPPDGWTNATTGPGGGAPWSTTPDWTDTSLALFGNNPAGGWASDGTVVMQLDAYVFSGPNGVQDPFRGGIAQVVNGFVPGLSYTVSYDLMRFALLNNVTQIQFDLNPLVSLYIDGAEAQSTTPTGVLVSDLQNMAAVYQSHAWQRVDFTFTATSASHEIGFLMNASDDQNPFLLAQVYLDDVTIVPEPSLVGLGVMVGIAGLVRRRRSGSGHHQAPAAIGA